jgi:GH24 family phage-related lysozyme (muramidase)
MDTALVLSRLGNFEGRLPYMYRCTGGEVTVGIGHAIPTADDAVKLTWMVGSRAATPDEVRADYARIAATPKGQVASTYAPLTTCRLNAGAIDALVAADIALFTAKLAARLPNWDRYPDCVQAALFDMGFNLGVDGLLKFKKLLAACDAADWKTAAAESHRQGIGDDRNNQTAALILQALT